MKVQAIATMYIERDAEGFTTDRHRRGDVFELANAEAQAGIAKGLLRDAGERGPLPPPNWMAATGAPPTQPDGTPLETDAEGNPLIEGAPAGGGVEPANHKEADAKLAELGLELPAKATLPQKRQAIAEYLAAQSPDAEPTGSGVDFSELSDEELLQIGVDVGLAESELVELGHDELVAKVAEAANQRTAGDSTQEPELAGG